MILSSLDKQSEGRGMLIVVSSPSGGGKGTLIRRVREMVADVGYSVSYTTRAPRDGEVNARHYHFVTKDEFARRQANGEFLESAEVHGNFYATAWSELDAAQKGCDVILEIDVQGATAVRERMPQAVSVFILPPSFEVLTQRLTGRASENSDDLALRLRNARREVEQYVFFDYVILNDDAARAAAQLASVIYAERARRQRQQEIAQSVLATFEPN